MLGLRQRLQSIDRKIKRAWLDAMLDRMARTWDKDTLRAYLDEILRQELPGNASRALWQ